MADSLKTLLVDQLIDLHDSVVAHLDDHAARDVLGEELDQLRSSGTGKSLVMLALLDDLLRIIEIVLAHRWSPLEPNFAEFAAPFFQSAARSFAKKGLKQYAPFEYLTTETAGRFLEFHANSSRPFGGNHAPTQWSGLQICTNVASRYGSLATLNGYERLTRTLLSTLAERIPHAKKDDVRQLVDFITDRCGDVRDQLQAQQRDWESDQNALAGERAELTALRTELAAQESQLAEREQLIRQEWKRFQQERAEFEQLRQQWEERLADQPDHAEERERLANERETLAIEKAALNMQREQLEAAQTQWERTRNAPAVSPDLGQKLLQELAADRRKLEQERAALWHEREELATLRERLLAEHNQPPEEDHILIEGDSFKQEGNENAAVMTANDAHQILVAAAMTGDAVQLRIALKWGADVNHVAADQNWQTPLHLAARNGRAQIVEALLDAGADAERTDAESLNPLESAIINEQPRTTRLLADRVPETIAQAYPVLAKILRDAKSPVLSRQLCVEAIGHLKTQATDSIPTLLNLLESESRELGRAAVEALAKIDPVALSAQAIPYLSYILEGPLVKSDGTDPRWIANLYAARGDLHRLTGEFPLAVRDYEAALNFAAHDQRPALQQLVDQLEPHISESQFRNQSPQAISSPRET